MSQPYIGEIRMFGGNFAPAGWAFCNGQVMAISENDTLFELIGTTYGGDGQTTFNLPDLQGRIPLHVGTIAGTTIIGQKSGTESITLTVNQIPSHSHTPQASAKGGSDDPANNYWGGSTTAKPYAAAPGTLAMNTGNVLSSGGNQPHDNMIPFQCVSYIISLFGIFPSQN
jgi:microcystin-dependent protein